MDGEPFLDLSPAAPHSYSNPAFWLAGSVVESVSDKRYADEMMASLFKPLGMSRTTLRPLVAMMSLIAQGHSTPRKKARP